MKKTEQEIKLLIEKYPNVPAFAIPTTKNKPKGKNDFFNTGNINPG